MTPVFAGNRILPVEIQALRPHISTMNLAAQDGRQSAAAQFRAPGLPPGNSAAANAPESLSASSGWDGVTRLVLTDFRNYRSTRLDLDAGPRGLPVVLTGPNGAGKTNLLEAVSFLSPGRGLRRGPRPPHPAVPAGRLPRPSQSARALSASAPGARPMVANAASSASMASRPAIRRRSRSALASCG